MNLASTVAFFALFWSIQKPDTSADFRGLSVVSSKIVWASGNKGTVIRTIDGGKRWQVMQVPGAETLDFRDIEAFDAENAVILSIGEGDKSRIYRTRDGGEHWQLAFTNPDPIGFFDAFAFFDKRRGVLVGDPVHNRISIFTPNDGGRSWQRHPGPKALDEEGAFAASGTCVAVWGDNSAWIGTGGPAGARVFRSNDAGRSWTAASAPLGGAKTSGIFSLLALNEREIVAVGGDYKDFSATRGAVALSHDGGETWTAPTEANLPFRSGVTALDNGSLISVGTGGTSISTNRGQQWQTLSTDNLNAVDAKGKAVWAVGPAGAVRRLED